MTFRDLQEWAAKMSQEQADQPLTPDNLLRVVDPKMADVLDEFLGTIFMNAPEPYKTDAMRLLVLLHIPIGQ